MRGKGKAAESIFCQEGGKPDSLFGIKTIPHSLEDSILWIACGTARHYAIGLSLIHMGAESVSRCSPIVEKPALILLPPEPSRF